MRPKNHIVADSFHPLKDTVFVTDLEGGVRLSKGGIIIPDDDMKDYGIRDRWARVYAVGPDVDDLTVGEWVLVKHGRWTPGIDLELSGEMVRVWSIDYPEAVMLVSDEDPRSAMPTTVGGFGRA